MTQEPENDEASRAAAAELERLSIQGIAAVNDADWQYNKTREAKESREHISEDFRLVSPDNKLLNWDQAVTQWREKYERWPGMYVVVTHISSDVQLGRGKASVHVQSNVVGAGTSVTFTWLSQRLWRIDAKSGKWMCYEMSGMRGTQSLVGFV
ncbi:uncharacterized protein RCC_00368 [Ramularia collo-cygni]|uniref:DUF4440 domain-containing protein n=1 Tax=Ramularia collo-cygni TaxID=112498 RepID=A0A2D3ULW5_9PEZI|nr:uncharacterized protein RCC_00368 [Ramularia collo-cygni]CZT14391.1 uncharacterized protein RCC_00368 [Ramularia collo-cygni]